MAEATETKECPACEQVIGKEEKTCPKCKVDLEALEEEVTVVERAQRIAEKRRKAATPPEPPPATKKSRSIFRSLGEKV